MSRNGSTRRDRKLRDRVRRRGGPCRLCGTPIDYALPAPHPKSFSVDHIIPVAHAPHLRYHPPNLQAAHLKCNRDKSDSLDTPATDNLETSETW